MSHQVGQESRARLLDKVASDSERGVWDRQKISRDYNESRVCGQEHARWSKPSSATCWQRDLERDLLSLSFLSSGTRITVPPLRSCCEGLSGLIPMSTQNNA